MDLAPSARLLGARILHPREAAQTGERKGRITGVPSCDPVFCRDTVLGPGRFLERGDSPNLSGSIEDENGAQLCLQAWGCGRIQKAQNPGHGGRWSRA